MMRLTKSQGERLCELIHLLRGWDIPGITAAVRKAAELGPAADVCVAALRVAANPEANTPGLIPSPGPHWQGTVVASRIPPTMCGIHPEQRALGCPECKAMPPATTTPAQRKAERAAARQRARQLAANPPQEDETDE